LLEANTELIHHCADLQSENDVQAQQSALLYVNINIISTNAQNACNHTGSVYERLEKNLMYMTKQYEKFVEKGKQQPSASNSINPNENGVNIRDKSRT
jgi:arginine utilization protein RocB